MSFRSFLSNHPWALKAWCGLTGIFSEIHWPRTQAFLHHGIYFSLREEDHDHIRDLLRHDYLVILTRRKSHFTTYLIALASWFTTGKPAHYTHALMNVEGDLNNNIDYKLIEATAPGVHYSTFMKVFDCDSVALLKPRGVSLIDWTFVLDAVKKQYGKKYDTLFDISNDENVSCVEMIYQGLKMLPNWQVRFAELVALIESSKELTPQMLYDCGDLDVVFEVRR